MEAQEGEISGKTSTRRAKHGKALSPEEVRRPLCLWRKFGRAEQKEMQFVPGQTTRNTEKAPRALALHDLRKSYPRNWIHGVPRLPHESKRILPPSLR